jgi:A/G-specific adenine glycosylase
MDLGATLCRPKRPLCLVCPLLSECGGPLPADAKPASKATGDFRGSRRYYRGRLVDALRRLPDGGGLAKDQLVASVGGADDGGRVSGLVEQLAAEGLLSIDAQNRVRLPD